MAVVPITPVKKPKKSGSRNPRKQSRKSRKRVPLTWMKRPKRNLARERQNRKRLTSKKEEGRKRREDAVKYEKYYDSGDYSQFPLYASTVCGVNIKKNHRINHSLTPDAVLRFSPDGLSIFGMEQVRMAILSTHFETGLFHPFKCDQVFEIEIDTQHLSRACSMFPSSAAVIDLTINRYDSLWRSILPTRTNPTN